MTRDHSHVFALKEKGLIEEDEIYTHPRRNEIYRSLGTADAVEVECFDATLHPGDLLLLCSDGLWEMLRTDGIADVLLLNLGDPQVICDELVSRANRAGGEDNISVVVVRAVG
ncbi:MAG: serine/threonine-protein phosphatase [Anaerolineales bacterium]|nr:serine/threonine-protein phosphatase [Anaerolineales bacterium]